MYAARSAHSEVAGASVAVIADQPELLAEKGRAALPWLGRGLVAWVWLLWLLWLLWLGVERFLRRTAGFVVVLDRVAWCSD